jgi:hypothetical protein
MVNVVSNQQLVALEAEDELYQEQLAEELSQPALDGIAKHITEAWEAARTQKQTLVKDRLLSAKRMRRGEYSPEKLREIREKTGGSEEYGRVVSNKCRIAQAWLQDVYLGQAELAWVLDATPVPELTPDDTEEVATQMQSELLQAIGLYGKAPPADIVNARRNELTDAIRMRIREEAKLTVERMQDYMADQLIEAGWREQWAEFLNDFVTFPAAHFKGPIYQKRVKLKWKTEGGSWVPVPVTEIVPVFYRVDPFRAYPSPGATSPQDNFWIEHITLERGELYDLIGVEGYNEEEIRLVLEKANGASLVDWLGLTDVTAEESARGDIHRYLTPQNEIDALEFYGPIPGRDLLAWGVPKSKIPDPDKDYEVTAWLIDRHVIKVHLNPNPLGLRPIYKVSWEEVPGEYWGQGLPDGLKDIDGISNACIRALVNNVAMASGPQVGVDVSRLPAGEHIQALTPWRIWQIEADEFSSGGAPLTFFQPQMNAAEIIGVLEKIYQYADDWSLIPRYMGGSDSISGGVGRTASGMSMLFNAANKGLKGVVSNIDLRVLTPMLQALYTDNMIFDEDQTIKGDAQVVAKGAVALMQIETLQLRRNEFLTATANPVDMQVVGLEGRRHILREVAKGLDMDVNRVIPYQSTPPQPLNPTNTVSGQTSLSNPNEEQLFTGAAVTDNFSPNKMRSAA